MYSRGFIRQPRSTRAVSGQTAAIGRKEQCADAASAQLVLVRTRYRAQPMSALMLGPQRDTGRLAAGVGNDLRDSAGS
jgi:hypothetical protein